MTRNFVMTTLDAWPHFGKIFSRGYLSCHHKAPIKCFLPLSKTRYLYFSIFYSSRVTCVFFVLCFREESSLFGREQETSEYSLTQEVYSSVYSSLTWKLLTWEQAKYPRQRRFSPGCIATRCIPHLCDQDMHVCPDQVSPRFVCMFLSISSYVYFYPVLAFWRRNKKY